MPVCELPSAALGHVQELDDDLHGGIYKKPEGFAPE